MASNFCLHQILRSNRTVLSLVKRQRNLTKYASSVTVKTFGTSDKRKIHKSTVADLEIPKQSLTEYLFPRFDKFGNNIALVSYFILIIL